MRFPSFINFHTQVRRIPMTLRVLIVAVIAAIFISVGGNSGAVFATAGIIAMPARTGKRQIKRRIVSKAKRRTSKSSQLEEMTNLDIRRISLVKDLYPVNDEKVVRKAGYGGSASLELHIDVCKANEEKGIIYGIVISPDKADLEKQFAGAEHIEKAAHNFLAKGRNGAIDIDHDQKEGAGTVIESSILAGPDPERYPNAVKGSWGVAIQLADELKTSAPLIKGISMWGTAIVKADPNADPEMADPDGDGIALRILRTTMEPPVGDVQMAAALGMKPADYSDFETGAADYQWSEETATAAAKLLKMTPAAFLVALANGSAGDEPAEPDATEVTDPAAPVPAAKGTKILPSTNPMRIPPARRVLKATEPKTIKVNGEGTSIVEVKKGAPDRHRIIGKAVLFAAKAKLLSEGLLGEAYFETPEQLISKGLFAPGDFDPAGTLQPALAREVFDVTVDRSGFLKRIQTTMMNSIEQNVAVADVGERTFIRIVAAGSPGAAIADNKQAKTVNLAKQLHAYEVDLPFFVPFSLVYNYQGNLPALEQKIGEIVMLSNANQFVDLGLNGLTNTYDGSFLSLSEGYFALAKRVIAAATDGANPLQSFSIAADVTLTTTLKIMDAMLAKMSLYQRRYSNKQNVILLGTEDFESLEVARIARPNSEQVLVEGAEYRYRGHELIVVDYLDAGNFMLTPIQNLIFGMVTQGQGGTRLQSLEALKGIQHNLSSAVDYDFVNYQPIIVARP